MVWFRRSTPSLYCWPRRRPIIFLLPFLCAFFILAQTTFLHAQGIYSEQDEFHVKATFLYRLFDFTQWPEPPADAKPMNLCVYGDNPFGNALDVLSETKPRTVSYINDLADLPNCQVLYVSNSMRTQLNRIFNAAKNSPILTVSDIPDFAERGGMVAMELQRSAVRLKVNRSASMQAGLVLNAKLLEVSEIVDP